jgi:hypothetical protein
MIGGNVTVDPLSRAVAVKDAAMAEVMNLDTGEIVETAKLIGDHRYGDLIAARLRVRTRLKNEVPEFACAFCGTAAYIVSNQRKNFFFRHTAEDGSCTAKTRSALTEQEIRARKYHGLQESEAHKRIKSLIVRSLSADAKFHDILEERTWRSTTDPHERRQPDVQARLGHLRLAFEIQLSTTFLDVVVGRREFYRGENALLVWIMGSFDPEYRRLTTDDMLFSNNANILVADSETMALSETSGILHLRCVHRRPSRNGDEIAATWEEHVVPFQELIVDVERQRVFLFDYEHAERAILEEIEADRNAAKELLEEELRAAFLERWREYGSLYMQRYEHNAVWQELRQRLPERGVPLPGPDFDRELTALINAVLSARDGRPLGWNFKKLIEVGHHLAEHHPRLLLAYGYAIKEFDRAALLREQDKSDRWKRRSDLIAEALRSRDETYMPPAELLPLMHLLFPSVGKRLHAFLDARS